ncbi:siderophore-iron reductase FhuF [Burkholderia alba]|uniref:siderophore-iron reductase FhuF n=1 Tax=Burkholderia alba TaxID=2683677 RepID=UPI002B05CA3E|nr:siderophore-iron reductase FhuF [Burkholderia alba]
MTAVPPRCVAATAPARCLAGLAPAPLAPYLEQVWLGTPDVPPDTAGIALTALVSHRAELLDAMRALYGGDAELHARALLSQWSKYYFGLAAPAGVLAAALLGRPLDLSPDRVRLVLRAGMPAALYLDPAALGEPDDDPARRYAPLVAHLDAVIGMLAGMTRIAPRVLWSNAGNLLDYLLDQCAQLPGGARAPADAAWLFGPLGADGDANPLRTPVRVRQPRSALLPNPFRARRVCCVRYEIPGETQLCASCPLLLTMGDDALALQDAIR